MKLLKDPFGRLVTGFALTVAFLTLIYVNPTFAEPGERKENYGKGKVRVLEVSNVEDLQNRVEDLEQIVQILVGSMNSKTTFYSCSTDTLVPGISLKGLAEDRDIAIDRIMDQCSDYREANGIEPTKCYQRDIGTMGGGTAPDYTVLNLVAISKYYGIDCDWLSLKQYLDEMLRK